MSKNVPKLRFPGFTGDWKEKSLGEISEPLQYGLNSAACDFDGVNGYIRITDIDTDGNYIKSNRVSPKGTFSDDYLIEEGDILFARTGASTGKSYRYRKNDGRLFYAGFLIRARVKKPNNYEYVYYSMKTNRYENWVKLMSMRSGQPGINAQEFSSYNLFLPTPNEQVKISDLLSTIDSRITNQSSKLDSLQELKKGVMQKIFSQEIRFKREDGGEYPDWEEMSIASLGTFYNGLSGKSKKDFSDGNKKYITYMNVFKNSIANPDDVSFVKINENEKQNIVGYGDVIFTQSSETVEEVGMSSVWMGDEEVYLNSFCFGFRPSSHSLTLPEYLAQVLRSGVVRSRIMMEGHGTTRINLSSARLGNVEIPIPKSIEEQQKIADFLSTLDSKISLESQILETLQTLKKGLLQQMFV